MTCLVTIYLIFEDRCTIIFLEAPLFSCSHTLIYFNLYLKIVLNEKEKVKNIFKYSKEIFISDDNILLYIAVNI